MLLHFARILPEFCQNSPKFAAIQNPDASGTHPDASGIGTSSAEICIWPLDRLLAHAAALGLKRPLSATDERGEVFAEEVLRRHPHTWGICTRRAGKLYRARSPLYRSQFLQVDLIWKALAEIYTMHSVLQLSHIIFLSTFCWDVAGGDALRIESERM